MLTLHTQLLPLALSQTTKHLQKTFIEVLEPLASAVGMLCHLCYWKCTGAYAAGLLYEKQISILKSSEMLRLYKS